MQSPTEQLPTTITVILPVYNGGNYLPLSVESVLKQSFHNFKFLILDDCSTDDSWRYINCIKDERVTTFRNEKNKGLFFNLNFLINSCHTTLIKLWSQDDIMYPHCLDVFVKFHTKHPEIGFSYSGRDIIDQNGQTVISNVQDNTPELISPDLHALIAFFTGSIAGNIANVCLNSAAIAKVGLFKEEMKISADFDMWVRLAQYFNTGFISESLIALRNHEGQLSRNENYLINHVREDLNIYRYLLGYVNETIKDQGVAMLRRHKFVFYYTLMIKTLLKGKIKGSYSFYKELSSFDNIFVLTYYFLIAKFFKAKKPGFLVNAH